MSDTTPSESEASNDGTAAGVRARVAGLDRATRWVAAVTAVALVARLYDLGWRVMHFDEGRVAYWALDYARTGDWQYRYIVHGPFVQHVDSWLFTWLGPTDFVARLPVAVVGGLLPLSVLLYRDRFSDAELAGMALVLAANPILLYYSRFMRSDVLVAGFMFVALGFLVRLWDRGQSRDLYLAALFVALGFTAKENAVVYLVCWVGMFASVGAMELLYPRRFESRGAFVGAATDRVNAWAEWALRPASRPWVGHAVGAVVVFAGVLLFFYAPRTAGSVAGGGSGVGGTITGTLDALERGYTHWGGTGVPGCFTNESFPLMDQLDSESDAFNYLCNLGREAAVIRLGALPTMVFAAIGFGSEWPKKGARVLVPAAFAWGVASVLGYPIGTDIMYPSWIVVHVVVPMAIPAGVGFGLLVDWGRESLAADEALDAAIAVGAAVLLVTSMVGVAAHHSYVAPQAGSNGDMNMAQYAQPSGEMQAAVEAMIEASEDNEGVDVIVYGSDFVDMGEHAQKEPACVRWLLPMTPVSWYLYRADATVRCAEDPDRLDQLLEDSDAPVVIASERQSRSVDERIDDRYESASYGLRLGTSPQKTAVFYFDTTRVDWNEST